MLSSSSTSVAAAIRTMRAREDAVVAYAMMDNLGITVSLPVGPQTPSFNIPVYGILMGPLDLYEHWECEDGKPTVPPSYAQCCETIDSVIGRIELRLRATIVASPAADDDTKDEEEEPMTTGGGGDEAAAPERGTEEWVDWRIATVKRLLGHDAIRPRLRRPYEELMDGFSRVSQPWRADGPMFGTKCIRELLGYVCYATHVLVADRCNSRIMDLHRPVMQERGPFVLRKFVRMWSRAGGNLGGTVKWLRYVVAQDYPRRFLPYDPVAADNRRKGGDDERLRRGLGVALVVAMCDYPAVFKDFLPETLAIEAERMLACHNEVRTLAGLVSLGLTARKWAERNIVDPATAQRFIFSCNRRRPVLSKDYPGPMAVSGWEEMEGALNLMNFQIRRIAAREAAENCVLMRPGSIPADDKEEIIDRVMVDFNLKRCSDVLRLRLVEHVMYNMDVASGITNGRAPALGVKEADVPPVLERRFEMIVKCMKRVVATNLEVFFPLYREFILEDERRARDVERGRRSLFLSSSGVTELAVSSSNMMTTRAEEEGARDAVEDGWDSADLARRPWATRMAYHFGMLMLRVWGWVVCRARYETEMASMLQAAAQ